MGNDWYVFVFTANEFTGELIDSPEGKLEWVPDEKIFGLNLWESDHIFMPFVQGYKVTVTDRADTKSGTSQQVSLHEI
jgi:8-oxo-dGTP diphosphatase